MKESLCWILLALSFECLLALKHGCSKLEDHRTIENQPLNCCHWSPMDNLLNRFIDDLIKRSKTLEKGCCNCSMNGVLQPIIQKQKLIMDGLKQLTKYVESKAKAEKARARKMKEEFQQATERLEAGFQKMELGMVEQMKKLSDHCTATSTKPTLQEIDNRPGDKKWRVTKKPVVEDHDY